MRATVGTLRAGREIMKVSGYARHAVIASLLFIAACASAIDEEEVGDEHASSSDAIMSGDVTAAVTTARVNLRDGPSTSDEVLLQIAAHARPLPPRRGGRSVGGERGEPP